MRGRGEIRRKGGLIACLAVAAALLAGGGAFGASDTISGTDNVYSQATYSADQGSVVSFQNLGTSNQHNVTASALGPDGKALFRTPTQVGPGSGAQVQGTQYLSAGSYPFICSLHPDTMSGTLTVTGVGTAQPRPQLTLKLTTTKIAKALKKGLQVQVGASAPASEVTIEAKLGKTALGKAAGLSLPPGNSTVKLKLGNKGRSTLANKSKATVSLSGSVAFGPPAAAKGKLK